MEPEPEPERDPPLLVEGVRLEVVATERAAAFTVSVAGSSGLTLAAAGPCAADELGVELSGSYARDAFAEAVGGGGGLFGQGVASPFFVSATLRLPSGRSLTKVRLTFGTRRAERDAVLAWMTDGAEPTAPSVVAERGLQLLGDDEPPGGAEDLGSLIRQQEEAAAALAVDLGGVHLRMEGAADDEADEDGESSDDDEGEDGFVDVRGPGAPGVIDLSGGLTAEERAECEQLVSHAAAGLALTDEERVQVASDCRAASALAFTAADTEVAQLTMVKVATEIGLSDGEVAFFSDISGLDDQNLQGPRAAGYSVPAAQLGPAKRFGVVFLLVGTLTSEGRYDARQRAFLRRLAEAYGVDWSKIRAAEVMHLEQMVVRKSREADAQAATQTGTGWGRALKVGGAAVLGGAAMVLTAGVAAPAVVGVFGLVGLGGVLSAVGGAGFVSVLFGAAGAGLGGYKVARRTGDVEEFAFDPIGQASYSAAAVAAAAAGGSQGKEVITQAIHQLPVIDRYILTDC